MSNLIEDMTSLLSGTSISKLSSTIGANPSATIKGVGAGLPALLGAAADTAKLPGGAEALLNLLNSDTNKQNGISDGSILDNLGNLLNNPSSFGGASLLNSLFSLTGGLTGVNQKLTQLTGLPSGTIGQLLSILAPVVLGFIGKKVTTDGLNAASLTQFLSDQQGLARTSAPGLLGFLEKIDANDDGSIVDDIQRLFGRLAGR